MSGFARVFLSWVEGFHGAVHVVLCFFYVWYALALVYRCRACIIGCQRQSYNAVIAVQECSQIVGAEPNVALGIEAVDKTQIKRCSWHDLHQSGGTPFGGGVWIEPGFHFNDRPYKLGINMFFISVVFDHIWYFCHITHKAVFIDQRAGQKLSSFALHVMEPSSCRRRFINGGVGVKQPCGYKTNGVVVSRMSCIAQAQHGLSGIIQSLRLYLQSEGLLKPVNGMVRLVYGGFFFRLMGKGWYGGYDVPCKQDVGRKNKRAYGFIKARQYNHV